MTKKKIKSLKASNGLVVLNESKLRRSLERSGSSELVINDVMKEVETFLYDGITIKEIFKKVFVLPRKNSPLSSSRYKLKKAIKELGPAGYPAERITGKILNSEGFETKAGDVANRHCVNHEMAVIAEKDEKQFMAECKFHSEQGRFYHVTTSLYIHSGFKDVEKPWRKPDGREIKHHQGWIFTNPRFTTDFVQYSTCSGLMLVGWKYRQKGRLHERIDNSGGHPVACLTTLTRDEKQKLQSLRIRFCVWT